MNAKKPSIDIVRAFAQYHGIPNLALSEAGTAGLRLQDGAELYLEQVANNGKLFVYVIMGSLPSSPEARLAYMEQLLSLNCLEQGTQCGSLAIDGLTDTVLLQAGIAEADLSVARLEQAAQALLLHQPRLAEELKRYAEGGATQKKAALPTVAQLNRWIAAKDEK